MPRHFPDYIAELMCRMAYLEPTQRDLEDIELPWAEPPFQTPPILIHTTTTRAAKIWPVRRWKDVLGWCEERNYKVGLVGASPKNQKTEYNAGDGEDYLVKSFPKTLIDLRGQTNLIQLAEPEQAKAVVSVDADSM